MSRSYKKVPGWSDQERNAGTKRKKRAANKRVRKYVDLADGSSYKKLYEQWDINDYSFRYFSEITITDYLSETNWKGEYPLRYKMFMK